jgi:hypothetical protein
VGTKTPSLLIDTRVDHNSVDSDGELFFKIYVDMPDI